MHPRHEAMLKATLDRTPVDNPYVNAMAAFWAAVSELRSINLPGRNRVAIGDINSATERVREAIRFLTAAERD